MNEIEYRQLMKDLCEIIDFKDVDTLYQTGQLLVDDMRLIMYFEEALDPDRMFVYVDVCPMKPEADEGLYKKLLEWNLSVDHTEESIIGLHPNSGNLVLRATVVLDDTITGEVLAEKLARLMNRSESWKDLLDEYSEQAKSKSRLASVQPRWTTGKERL